MSTGSIMDDSDSADVVSVAPSTVSELSSFAAFNDTGNEAASASAAADGGESEFGIPEVTRHPLFWFDNDIVKVQVENIAFQVHAHLFTRESDKGRTLMSEASGGTLVLEDVKAVDFERFLTMLYAKFYDAPKLSTAEEWISVLHLSHKWNFASLQAVAVCELDLLTTAVDKIVLSQQYGIHSWLERAYMDVCTADGWLSDEDGLRLGVAAVLRIGRARHELRMPAALKPESSRLDIVREICSLATTVVSPATTLACNLGSELVLTDASSGDAAEPTPPPSADPDSESVKEALKSFVENTLGWNGEDARTKWNLYERYGTTPEKEALRQAVAEARSFVARAPTVDLDASPTGAALLDTTKRAFEPIKARYELWTLSADAAGRFDRWLDICSDLLRNDPWVSSADRSQLSTTLAEAKRDVVRWRKQHHRAQSLTGQPPTTADQVNDRRRQLETEITTFLGSCPPVPPNPSQWRDW